MLPPRRVPVPGPGHISGPVAGIDRGFMAMRNPDRQRARQTIDSSPAYVNLLELRPTVLQPQTEAPAMEPHSEYTKSILPAAVDQIPNNYMTRHVQTCINRIKAVTNTVAFAPDGRRFITGSAAGELTIWHGHTFNFDFFLQSHRFSILSVTYTRSGEYMLTGDEGGCIRYWSTSMSQQRLIEPSGAAAGMSQKSVKTISCSPSDRKFATCSDDGTVKIWDFFAGETERILQGHTNSVTSVAWHPYKSVVASCAKDNMIKLWDPRGDVAAAGHMTTTSSGGSGSELLRTLSGHTSWPLCTKWNENGWWLASASRDNTIRVFDIRTMKVVQAMVSDHRGFTSMSWHPFSEKLLVGGCTDGAMQFWSMGYDYPQVEIPHAHDSPIWDFAWHPSGTSLVTVSSDCSTKCWARSRPGDTASQYAYHGNPVKGHVPGTNTNVVLVPIGPAGKGLPPHAGATSAAAAGGGDGGGGAGGGAGGTLSGGRSFAELSFESLEAETRKYVTEADGGGGDADAKRRSKLRGGRQDGGMGGGGGAGGDGAFTADGTPIGLASGGPSKLSLRGPPGPNYTCKACNVKGHWIEDCETLAANKAASRAAKLAGGGGGQQQQQVTNILGAAVGIPSTSSSSMNVPGAGAGGSGATGGIMRPPKPGYVCYKCNIPGHWLEECTNPPALRVGGLVVGPSGTVTTVGLKRPPPGYSCNVCSSAEHYKNECPVLAARVGSATPVGVVMLDPTSMAAAAITRGAVSATMPAWMQQQQQQQQLMPQGFSAPPQPSMYGDQNQMLYFQQQQQQLQQQQFQQLQQQQQQQQQPQFGGYFGAGGGGGMVGNPTGSTTTTTLPSAANTSTNTAYDGYGDGYDDGYGDGYDGTGDSNKKPRY